MHTVFVSFNELIHTEEIMEFTKDFFDSSEMSKLSEEIHLFSINQLINMNEKTLTILKDYFSQWTVTRVSDGFSTFINHNFIDKVLEAESAIGRPPKFNYMVQGSFNPSSRELKLEGFLAGSLYKAFNLVE